MRQRAPRGGPRGGDAGAGPCPRRRRARRLPADRATPPPPGRLGLRRLRRQGRGLRGGGRRRGAPRPAHPLPLPARWAALPPAAPVLALDLGILLVLYGAVASP